MDMIEQTRNLLQCYLDLDRAVLPARLREKMKKKLDAHAEALYP